ncbi:hypothetical protein GYMLUDRAFT_154798 [Collybiopsis luxurians FD-317 M1]|nr:hypothetical protein GYMLUDRAFT_154798 [Collybiopsis luxurians FD-317 M1]
MSTLAPPTSGRSRACSTTLRPALTLKSLGRRRSNSNLHTPPCPSHSSKDTSPPSMFFIALSTVLQWLHLDSNHPLYKEWSLPSTPEPNEQDVYALPLPASATKPSFGDIHAPIVFVICLFPLSTALVLLSLSTLPIQFSWPKTLTELAQLGKDLHRYSESGFAPLAHVVGVMAVTSVWKHAWSIPGSVIWNVLAGALFSPLSATILLTTLTTVGSLCASMLATPLAPFIMRLFPRVLDMTRAALEGNVSEDKSISTTHASGAWVRLSVLRLVGVVPWSGINIACGVCGVPLWDCMLGSFIGTLPWTAVTCQIGDILQTVASAPSATPQTVSSLLMTPEIIVKLVFLSILSLAPIMARNRLKALISMSTSETQSEQDEKRVSRWTWMKEWKARLPSRSRTRNEKDRSERMRQLDELVDEKQQLRIREEGMVPS